MRFDPVMTPYRLMHWLYLRHIPVLPQLIQMLWFRLLLHCYIPCSCSIGTGTVFPHGALGVLLHKECVIGRRCKIQSHVVIGGRNGIKGAPHIGDGVLIGAQAVVLGNITIGDHAAIGAGAVVTADVPPHCVVMGPKAQVTRMLRLDESVF